MSSRTQKRSSEGRFVREGRPLKFMIISWLGAFLSVALLIPTGYALKSDLSGFRSCNINSSGLMVSTCGKQAPNAGDAIILLLFIGACSVVVSLFTHAWRLSRKAG